MQNKVYEVVAVILPEKAADHDPRTVLVRIYQTNCLIELDRAIQNFVKTEKPASHYRTIPVGSAEDFVEYWLEFSSDATEFADKLRCQLSAVYSRITKPRRANAEGATAHRPDGLAA